MTPESTCCFSCRIILFFSSTSLCKITSCLFMRWLFMTTYCRCGGKLLSWDSCSKCRWKCCGYMPVIIVNQMIETFEHSYQVYRIGNQNNNFKIEKVQSNDIYNGQHSYRRAVASPFKLNQGRGAFVDTSFKLQVTPDDLNDKGQRLVLRRIFQIYDRELEMFSKELMVDAPLKQQKYYPTFLSEFSMIDTNYIKTRFFTKTINEKGFYQYFVRRNGQYHVQFMDDLIPVDPETRMPPWGLIEKEPWKIVLMKAWLKEKKTIAALMAAEPYEFTEAFGFPGYRAIAIQKQVNSIAVSHLKPEVKAAKEKRISLDNPGYIVVGKTRDNEQVQKLGLIPNRAGYRVVRTQFHKNKSMIGNDVRGSRVSNASKASDNGQDNIYKIHSSLPSYWVGEYSVFANSKIHTSQSQNITEDIQNIHNQFMASYFEISRVFSKFYICPEYNSNKNTGTILEDSMSVDVGPNAQPFYYFELRVKEGGFLNLNIQLPLESGQIKLEEGKNARRYAYIKYMMAKKSEKESRGELQGYHYYDGEYVKGYHKSLNRFIQIEPGMYYIYFKIEKNKYLTPKKTVAININTNAKVQSFRSVDHRNPKFDFQFVMMATLHNYNMRFGVKTYVGRESKREKNLVVHISHSFDQIGFGLISIASRPPTETFLAMNIFQSVLLENRMNINREIHRLPQNQDEQKLLTLVAKQSEAKIVVIERTIRTRQVEEKFPPPGSVDFYQFL